MILIPKIYILEAEETFVLRFKIILQKVGISIQEFISFRNEIDLITRIEEHFPDIVFIDLSEKDVNKGFLILHQIKQKYNGKLKVGIISSSEDILNIKKASDLGARFYVVKTGNINLFSERIKKLKQDFLENDTKSFMIYN